MSHGTASRSAGTAVKIPVIRVGTKISETIAEIINHFGWQGKVFDAKKGVLKNRILVIGLEAILARVYKAPSWLDNKECIVLDYSDTSIIASRVRDEIRRVFEAYAEGWRSGLGKPG